MLARSFRSRANVRSISVWLSAVTAIATSWMFSSRLRAVTVISSSPSALLWARAAGAVRPVPASMIARLSRLRPAVCRFMDVSLP